MTYPPYTRYAEIYDRDQTYFSRETARYLAELLHERGWQGERILDLACGTGTLAIDLAGKGYEVWGVDLSADMLAQAEKKAALAKRRVSFVRQDMRQLKLPLAFDLVTCVYDSLNYLQKIADIQEVFRRVYDQLNPEGLFFFDMNSLYALGEVWGTRTEAEDDVDLPYIWTTVYDATRQLSSLTATFFVRRGDLYERVSEVHVERGYPQEAIVSALVEAGFSQVEVLDWGTDDPATPTSERLAFLARRTGG